MSNMQLKGGPHGAWAGACRTSSGREPTNYATHAHVHVHARNFYIHDACTHTAAHAMLLCDNKIIPKVKGHSVILAQGDGA